MVEPIGSDPFRWIFMLQIFYGCSGHESLESMDNIEKKALKLYQTQQIITQIISRVELH